MPHAAAVVRHHPALPTHPVTNQPGTPVGALHLTIVDLIAPHAKRACLGDGPTTVCGIDFGAVACAILATAGRQVAPRYSPNAGHGVSVTRDCTAFQGGSKECKEWWQQG